MSNDRANATAERLARVVTVVPVTGAQCTAKASTRRKALDVVLAGLAPR